MESARSRTIRRALEVLGDEKALAYALGVQLEDVRSWLTETAAPDDRAYFAALDIVAVGPLFSGRRGKQEKG